MALIACPECDRTVSDQAPACPGCGYPVASVLSPVTGPRGRAVQTVEATGKGWKVTQLVGVLLAIAAFVVAVSSNNENFFGAAAGAMVIGLLVFVYGCFGAWWNHG